MVKDRLPELHAKLEELEPSSAGRETTENFTKMVSQDSMSEFQQTVHGIEESLRLLREDVNQIRRLHRNLICDALPSESDKQALEKKSDKIFADSVKIRKKIESLSGQSSCYSSSIAEQRIFSTQLKTLSNRLREIMSDFRTGQGEYVDKEKRMYQRQVNVVSNGDSEKFDTDINNQSDLFTGGILTQTQIAKSQLQEIEDRGKEIKKLEEQIVEINELFLDMNALVFEQGTKIDDIASNVENAASDVESGKDQLIEAEKLRKKARRKKMICIAILIVVIAVVCAIIALIITQSVNK